MGKQHTYTVARSDDTMYAVLTPVGMVYADGLTGEDAEQLASELNRGKQPTRSAGNHLHAPQP